MNARQALYAAVGIVAALGALGIVRAMGPDREALRAELKDALDRADALEPAAKDRRLEELLANEEYQAHARAQWLRAEKMHGPAHQAARAEEAARKAVPPFLARCADLDGKPSDDLRSLDDEARSLQNEHGATRHAPALKDARDRIASRLAAKPPGCNDLDHFRIQQEAQKERLAGKYAAALKRLQGAVATHPKCDAFLARSGLELETLLKSAAASAEKLLAAARADRRPEPLEKALPDFQGLPDWSRLDATRRQLRGSATTR